MKFTAIALLALVLFPFGTMGDWLRHAASVDGPFEVLYGFAASAFLFAPPYGLLATIVAVFYDKKWHSALEYARLGMLLCCFLLHTHACYLFAREFIHA